MERGLPKARMSKKRQRQAVYKSMIRHNLLPSAMVDVLGSPEDVYQDSRVDLSSIVRFPDGSLSFDSENLAARMRQP